jgi:hypothetical protein
MGRHDMSSSRMIRAPLSFGLYFLPPASQLTDKLVRWFLIQRTRPHYSRSHFSNSRARCHPPPLHPPLSLLLHLLRSQAPTPLLQQAPSCHTSLCRPRRYISSNLSLVGFFFLFLFLFFLHVGVGRRRPICWSCGVCFRRRGGGVGLHLLTEYLIYFVLVTIFVLCGSRESGTSKTISYVIVDWKKLFPKMLLSGGQGLTKFTAISKFQLI